MNFTQKEISIPTLEDILLIPSEDISLEKRLLLPIHFRQISVMPSTNQIITEDIFQKNNRREKKNIRHSSRRTGLKQMPKYKQKINIQ